MKSVELTKAPEELRNGYKDPQRMQDIHDLPALHRHIIRLVWD
jgi:hypothetical protein